jgi:hypothetical protein
MIHLYSKLTFCARILFWHVDEELYNARQLLENAETHTRTAQERNMPREDILALDEAFRHLCAQLKVL